ncbi:hypothetical protein STCU_01446 [Strigomonas culicis]|uniref:BART domain-containing protein n=1 Tax=Strigomonas culicis TaxID=28005 RepID=S9W621_9TRYP|nr:hypothetical protein STCU_01446 [Strigomonas culicis]|eukprot:EPY34656.1 hypothetical protein STCU_01446 [Strigomonas culicis]
MEKEQAYLQAMVTIVEETWQRDATDKGEEKPGYSFNTDTREGLEAFSLYKRYAEMIEEMLMGFMERETAGQQQPVSLEDLAAAVMEEWATPEGAVRYLCTAYIAAALDFNDFCELAMDYTDLVGTGTFNS